MDKTTNIYTEDKTSHQNPLFLLCEQQNDYVLYSDRKTTVKQCFCADCKKIFPVNLEYKNGSWNIPKEQDISQFLDIECPECKNKSYYVPIKPFSKHRVSDYEIKTKLQQYNIQDSDTETTWLIPPVFEKRTISLQHDKNGTTTRMNDSAKFSFTSVVLKNQPEGNMYKLNENNIVYSEITDLVKNQITVAENQIMDKKYKSLAIAKANDIYKYKPTIDKLHIKNARPAINNTCLDGGYLSKSELMQTHNPSTNYGINYGFSIDPERNRFIERQYSVNEKDVGRDTISNKICYQKMNVVKERFQNKIDKFYTDTKKNGLFLKEHHIGSNEENTPIDYYVMGSYFNMMVKYPVAFEYACERADAKIINHNYEEKRKVANDNNYVPRELPDSAKARIFREEANFVAEQLASVDNKILATIAESKDVEDMKHKLQFFVFGNNDKIVGTKTPEKIHLKDNKTIKDPLQASKFLKREFQNNPIGLANTIYTCHKIGIKDPNFVNRMIEIANKSPSTNDRYLKRFSKKQCVAPRKLAHINAKTICPITTNSAMRFIRNYANSHDHGVVIDNTYGSESAFLLFSETVKVYSEIAPYVKILDKPDEIKANLHDIEKNQVRNYLMFKTIQDAYVDFIEKYKDKTPEIINAYAKEIKEDETRDKIKKFYDENGLEATMAEYGSYLKDIENPEKYLDEYVLSTASKCVLATRDGKPLFANRSMKEIHDELAHMAKNAVRENVDIEYSDEEREFESVYDAPDASGQWSFNLHKDTFEMVRTATELKNCVASHTNIVLSKQETLLYMKNELNEKVACISLIKRNNRWRVGEFQAANDNAVDARYKDICLQWLNDHNIDYKNNRDVRLFGTGKSIYGRHDADFHTSEIDEATNSVVSATERQNLAKKRRNMAIKIYGLTDDGQIDVPTAPEF